MDRIIGGPPAWRASGRIPAPYRCYRFNTLGNQSVEATIDLFNSLNTNTIFGQANRNGPTYLAPTDIIAPRGFRLRVKYRF